MAELLFEIACEEIPARMQEKAAHDLARLFKSAMDKAGLAAGAITTLSGPRRLVLTADVPLRSPDTSEERKGPRVGSHEKALAGFMRGAGLTDISEAQTRSDKKGEFYVAIINTPGRPAADIVAEIFPEIMGNFPWPKSMKSGASDFRWVRPLTSLLCLLDGEIVDFEIGGIKTGNLTYGHRRMGNGPFSVSSAKDYRAQLEGAGHVMLDAQTRKDLILTQARAACAEAGYELVEDAGLLAEVAGLAEWPVVILGDMDRRFLELPAEVIRLSMRDHQKYFAVHDPKTGGLAPHFIVVANQVAPDGGKAIAQGNAKVLSARLADAEFFQSQDRAKKLEDYYPKLSALEYHKKLGSVQDKAERIAALARGLAPIVGADPKKAERAARLAKCDLVTQTVVEFTSLQGQIGRLMLEAEGGDSEVVAAIEEHYKPKGVNDTVPSAPVSVAVALADKLDTLVSFWAIDEKPTGSKDPFALRRAALGVVRIVLENDLNLNLFMIFRESIDATLVAGIEIGELDEEIDALRKAGFSNLVDEIINRQLSEIEDAHYGLSENWPKKIFICRDLLSFILDRLKIYLRDQGHRHDVIDAVVSMGGDDLADIARRVAAIGEVLGTDDGKNLLAGYKRAANILKAEAKKGAMPDAAPGAGAQSEETALYDAITAARPSIETALAGNDYGVAMSALAALRGPIDAFFEHVTVNSDDAGERANRLALLAQVRTLAGTIADFDKLEG